MRRSLRLQRCFCSSVAAPENPNTLPKAFEDIPGPRGPFGMGNLYKYLPWIGSYSWLELHKAGMDKYLKYGDIVRETMVPGENIVWLYDPQDIATLLKEREYPQRRSHLALEKYRKDRPHIYRSSGLLPTNGEEWWRLRSELQKEISAPTKVRSFMVDVDKVTQEFLDHLRIGHCFNVLPKLSRLNLELTCLITFGERLNSFSPAEQHFKSRSSRLIHATETTNISVLPTDQGLQLWRRFETPAYRQLRKSQQYMEMVAIDLVAQKLNYFKEEEQNTNNTQQPKSTRPLNRSCLIEEYLKNPNLDLSDVVGMACDLLLAGVDTTSYTTAFALYHISQHPQIQENIFQEACRVLPSRHAKLSVEAMKSEVSYTRAVLKEVFRLNPISVGVGRILNKEMILGGYQVPKGTVVVTQNMIACRLEKYFDNPLSFNPDRWLNRKQAINPHLVIPFGHGMRACIARRLAEQNILILLLRITRNFEIIWKGDSSEMDVKTLLINKPSEPVKIILRKRKS